MWNKKIKNDYSNKKTAEEEKKTPTNVQRIIQDLIFIHKKKQHPYCYFRH